MLLSAGSGGGDGTAGRGDLSAAAAVDAAVKLPEAWPPSAPAPAAGGSRGVVVPDACRGSLPSASAPAPASEEAAAGATSTTCRVGIMSALAS